MNTGAHATTPRYAKLIEPQSWHERDKSDDCLLVHVGSAESYAAAHIPGALWLAPEKLVSGVAPAVGKLASTQQLGQAFGELGLRADKHVVAYDDEGGGWAGRLIWTLEVLGHGDWSYLNGGLRAWQLAGFPVERDPNQGTPCDYTARIDKRYLAELEDVLKAVQNSDSVIWDARSAEEYTGERQLAKRGGHVPGAVHYEWLRLMDDRRGLRLRDLDELREELTRVGIIKQGKPIITHCQSHHRSGLCYLVGRLLDLDIAGYHGSWSEWGNRDDTPVETGSMHNH